ncbi:MAG TPA: YtxH domain-containing protein [Syntrophorhabdaceae bacterium]|nr:YtxH domain-containing protein [Syntrophorhabdaceae bacterium]
MERDDGGFGFGFGSVVLSFFIGGTLGAAVALLMAPRSGKETRTMIRGLAQETKGKVDDYVTNAKEKASSYVERGKEFVEKEKNALSKSVEAGKEAYKAEKNV